MDRANYYIESDFRNAREVLERCSMFIGVTEAIAGIIKSGRIESADEGAIFIQQDARDKSVFFILEGEVDILINGRGVARRSAPTHVGEMAVVDPMAKRSATVVALEPSILMRVEENDFVGIANNHPRIWRNIASEISARLRQRGELVDEKSLSPRLFIGSSAEYLDVAHAIQEGLIHTDISVKVWTQDVFRPADFTLAALEREAMNSDFALFLFGNEDLVVSRGGESSCPRDNVVFELGLFSGKLSSERVYFAKEIGVDIKIPTDLAGVTPVQYKKKPGEEISISVQPICNQLLKRAKELGTK